MRDALRARIRAAGEAFIEQLVGMLEENVNQQLSQLELAFDAATSAFASDLHESSATTVSAVVDSPRPTKRSKRVATPVHRESEADGNVAKPRRVPTGRRDSNAVAADTSPKTRPCGCNAIGRHRRDCSLAKTSTSPASGPPPATAITSSPATSSISRSPARAPRSVQAPGRAAQAVGANAGDLTSPRGSRFAEIEASKQRREAAQRDRGERARAFVRKDGVKPTKAPEPAAADSEADEADLPASVRASFQF